MSRGSGRVSFYDPQRNYGFIEPDDHGADVIFYLRAGDGQLDVGDPVVFEEQPVQQVTTIGRQAITVERIGFPQQTG